MERMTFTGSQGVELAGRLELPEGTPTGMAVFAHCFTCSKDVAAASRVSRGLTRFDIGVLRFDFTGLGNSEGDFSNTDFSSNVADIVTAAHALEERFGAPQLLIGHSLGGAAVLRAARELPSVRAVATIGAPGSPGHVAHLLNDARETIEQEGRGKVTIGGRRFSIRREFLDDLRKQSQENDLRDLRVAKLIFHSPTDEIVGIENARELYEQLRHPKSFVSLDGADHLLTDRKDSEFVASVLSAWAQRYVTNEAPDPVTDREEGEVHVLGRSGSFRTRLTAGSHSWTADEPHEVGGTDRGPSPYDMLLAALGTCTSMTMHMYAKRKKIPLEEVEVVLRHDRVHATDGADAETEKPRILERLSREIQMKGELTDEQRAGLTRIADKCPVHRTLRSHPEIATTIVDD